MSAASSSARILINQLKKMQKEPVEGFTVELIDESDVYKWRYYIKGPTDTPYENGIYQGTIDFPEDYPFSPPTLTFTSEFWHPNVYTDGKVCISILHPPGEDEMSGERPEERWNPTQTPETILLSVISMLSDPNFSSPANVDASRKKANQELPPGFTMPEPFKFKPEPSTPLNADDEDFEFEIDEDDDIDLDEDVGDLDEEVIAEDEE
ncbi:hypothetical protein FDP41_001278 [Naegleria fowleri]|uniref:UBC core domain-containing protein n=1 Tax=Naegleria fowleri TaxID=5763 RepID=A0A6A5C179_NAEFO|nr:uncharacterized protein FDP41_001278 [Naegleria fowleri]KAF0979610.1 hypothetical protein FDP41_001278 [Naegleria fowleri]